MTYIQMKKWILVVFCSLKELSTEVWHIVQHMKVLGVMYSQDFACFGLFCLKLYNSDFDINCFKV